MVLLLCQDRYLSAYDLSELLGRSQHRLTVDYLMAMVREGQLETRFGPNAGGSRNSPQQAYKSAPSATSCTCPHR